MMRRITLAPDESFTAEDLDRRNAFDAAALTTATSIIESVRADGDAAVRRLTADIDHVELDTFALNRDDLEAALTAIDARLREALLHAARQIREFHERQKSQSWFFAREDGALLGAKVTPLDAVGIYVPGGRAAYPSTVLMNAIPAAVAGVERIAVTTPPSPDGVNEAVLAACAIAGVSEVYTIGGAQAIAALAYGTESIAPVDKITGPGNAYVAAAKKLVAGDVGIDMIAGPSEVCVVADDSARPELIALDLMAQAEHDPQAACFLVCFSAEFADLVCDELDRLIKRSPRAEITGRSLSDHGMIVICSSLTQALDAINAIAPEHLELQLPDPMELLGSIHHAGAIFLGPWTPEAVGDYVAGPNHTLPTGGTARYASPLSVDDFVKHSSIISFTPAALIKDGPAIEALAEREGLWAHGQSVSARLKVISDVLKSGGLSGVATGASTLTGEER